MRIGGVEIRNFRGISHLDVQLGDFTVLIGENNSGKTTIIDALRKCMKISPANKDRIFSKYDYHFKDNKSDFMDVDPIQLKLKFDSLDLNAFDADQQVKLRAILDNRDREDQKFGIQIDSFYNKNVNKFQTTCQLADVNENLMSDDESFALIQSFQEKFPLVYLPSLRDAVKEFNENSYFWRVFIENLIPDGDTKTEMMETLFKLNEQIVQNHTPFERVLMQLRKVFPDHPHDSENIVKIEAIPQKLLNLLSKSEIMLKSKTGADMPISEHGSGVQSLSVVYLFDSFIRHTMSTSLESINPILAIEEPEAHLDPARIADAVKNLAELSGQKIISTHSGHLISNTEITNIKKLRRYSNQFEINEIKDGDFEVADLSKLNYHIQSERGNLFFSRCWFLVEGYTDVNIVTRFAEVHSINFNALRISCIHHKGIISLEKLIKFAMSLGIEWIAMADGDNEGKSDQKKVIKEVGKKAGVEYCRERFFILDQKNIELCLFDNGFKELFVNSFWGQGKDKNVDFRSRIPKLEYYQKQQISMEAGEFAKRNGVAIPEKIRLAIEKAADLSKRFD